MNCTYDIDGHQWILTIRQGEPILTPVPPCDGDDCLGVTESYSYEGDLGEVRLSWHTDCPGMHLDHACECAQWLEMRPA